MRIRGITVWGLFIVILFVCVFSSFVQAAKITLKDGTVIEGKILEKTDTYIKLEVKGVPVPYFLDEISQLTEDTPPPEEPAVSSQEAVPESIVLGQEYVDKDYGFSIVFPENWTALELPTKDLGPERVINASRQGGGMIPRLVLKASRKKAENILQRVAQIEEESREAGGRIILVSPPIDVAVGSLNAKRWILDFQKFPAPGKGFLNKRMPTGDSRLEEQVKSESYLFTNNDVTVILELIAHNDERFKAEREEALINLKSFKFLD